MATALRHSPLAYLRTSWPWRAAGWAVQAMAAGGIVTGMGAAVLAPPLNRSWDVLTLGGAALELLMVTLFVIACAAVAAWQRRAVTLVGRAPVISAYRLSFGPSAPRTQRLGRAAGGFLRDGALVRDVAFCVLFAPLGVLAGALVVVVPPIAIGAIVALVLGLVGHPAANGQDWTTWVTAAAAVVVFVALPWLVGWLAVAGSALAQGIMDPHADRARAQAAQIAASRRRLAGAFDAERRRIERDLHDGVQQLIVAQAMTLGLAAAELSDACDQTNSGATDSGATRAGRDGSHAAMPLALVERAREENREILAQLRELVRRVHPQVLTDHGLAAALAEVVARSPAVIDYHSQISGRPPALLESTAYFVALEGLTNAAKHAPGARVTLRVATGKDMLSLTVGDDGPGGAQLDEAGGLRGLAERVAAAGGSFQVSSVPGRGTLLRADFPYFAAARTDLLDDDDPAEGRRA